MRISGDGSDVGRNRVRLPTPARGERLLPTEPGLSGLHVALAAAGADEVIKMSNFCLRILTIPVI